MTENTEAITTPEAAAEAPAVKKPLPTGPKNQETKQDKPQRGRGGGGGRGRGRGRRKREPKEFEESILQIDRVTRVTKGGRQLRFRISVVIGDKKGRVGFGIGKSSEVVGGIRKAVAKAKQNMVTIPFVNDSIPHAVTAKFKASQVSLYPAPDGKGVIAGGAVRKILDLSGIKNVLSKMHGSRNGINAAYATFEALRGLTHEAPYEKKKATKEEAPKAETKVEKVTETQS